MKSTSSSSSNTSSASFDFLSDFSVWQKSLTSLWLTLIISLLAAGLWYWILFHFDSDEQDRSRSKKKRRAQQPQQKTTKHSSSSSDDEDDHHQRKMMKEEPKTIIGHLRKNQLLLSSSPSNSGSRKFLSIFIAFISSPRFIFSCVVISIFTAWISAALFSLKFSFLMIMMNGSEKNIINSDEPISSSSKHVITIMMPFMFQFLLHQALFGICGLIYIAQENLSAGLITHLIQIMVVGSTLITRYYSSSSESIIVSSSMPHPLCANLQFVSIMTSLFVLIVFIVMFFKVEVRSVLQKDYPMLIEILERMLPDTIFPRTEKKKLEKEEKRREMIQTMKERRKRM